ncbi:DUF3265 domain-containing protein [Vibrio parahaemolyticus]|nr:DUF3265 domain-containing protein [Vibrio parahaemolyticus]TOO33720.1 DUF3265 domain-containing protein [Vibrio parahaemolyticus]TOO40129.1 DUF3265 domain-containing protein [Vibrio parahaemolyticus]
MLCQVNEVLVVKHNKQFKSDSQRMSFLVQIGFSVYGVMV